MTAGEAVPAARDATAPDRKQARQAWEVRVLADENERSVDARMIRKAKPF